MINTYRFFLETEVYYGAGFSIDIDKFLTERGLNDIFILVDEAVSKTTLYAEFEKKIKSSVKLVDVMRLRSTEEPDYDYLDSVADECRKKNIGSIIGLGGGSTLDISKAVSVLLKNPGRGIDYRGFDKVSVPGIPLIAIPTTAGTGSEVTINAVFTDKAEMKKLGINGRYMNAKYAILDPEWTLSCPKSVSVSSGMDAMTHALESFVTKKANKLTRTFAKEAFRLLYRSLPSIVDEPGNIERRGEILLGSYLAAASLFNAGSGIAGAFSYPMGVHYKIPHGIGGAIFLTPVADYNVKNGYYDYSELYDLMDGADKSLSVKEKAEKFVTAMYELANWLGVPRSLEGFGIREKEFEKVCGLLKPLQAAFDQNPVKFSAETDAPQLLRGFVK